ncbi:hypothetical protein TSAR_003535 [Trichomalopsis sarcophagae]|uniref:CCHC-type domain-containing protein n=1 Tax=Trichomalopsis sarcophagae TaxID=543379 RepID=A0A232EP38_9HYME|nr:hypothetical protein TSAR_003535 [Trichomalopsis sarcophagae]
MLAKKKKTPSESILNYVQKYIVDGIQDDAVNKMILYGAKSIPQLKEFLKTYEISRCFICGEIGHMSRECTHKSKKCFKCQKFGHIATQCTETGENKRKDGETVDATRVHRIQRDNTDVFNAISVQVENIKLSALIDSGSPINLIREDLYDQLKNKAQIKLIKEYLVGAGVKRFESSGTIDLPTTIDGHEYSLIYRVVPRSSIPEQLIIGNELRRPANIYLLEKETLVVPGANYAVDEPNFSVAYALMCKELSNMEVTGADAGDSSSANFRKLILTRCQTEFEKNTVDENARNEKLREIDECTDLEKKKELQIIFEEEERRIRVKSVGNIRFIGELFKQNMLTCKIMHQCIRHLLTQIDEENLECLCKLLTTIGKVLEDKQIDLSDHFKQMQQIANQKGKMNKWIPRRDDSNPKTMDQIQKEAESERMDNQLINSSLNTPRKDERTNERKRNQIPLIRSEGACLRYILSPGRIRKTVQIFHKAVASH